MPIKMSCPSCGKTLSAPDNAAGKKAKCPGCGQIMTVPEAVVAAEDIHAPEPEATFSPQPPAGDGASWLDEVQGAATPPTASGPGGDARRPCPECGEIIIAGAAKCRFCGAVFDPRLRTSSMQGGQNYRGFAITSMVLGILSLFCCGPVFGIAAIVFGVIAGNGMKASRNIDGKGMATAGVVLGIIGAVLGVIIAIIYVLSMAAAGGGGRHHF